MFVLAISKNDWQHLLYYYYESAVAFNQAGGRTNWQLCLMMVLGFQLKKFLRRFPLQINYCNTEINNFIIRDLFIYFFFADYSFNTSFTLLNLKFNWFKHF